MSNTTSSANVSPRRSYRQSPGPGILLIIAMFVLLGVGYTLWQAVVIPYQQTEISDPMLLGSVAEGCQPWIQVEHPTWLSLSDQGVQPSKRIVFTLECDEPLTHTVSITLGITSTPSGWLRFLNGQGEDMPPRLAVQVPPGGQGRVSLYPECLNKSTATTPQLALAVTGISMTEPVARFPIALESRPRTLLRHVVSSTLEPLSAGQLTLLGSLAALLWRWWKTWNEKRQGFSNLYAEMGKNRGDLSALRDLHSRYQEQREIFPLSVIYRDRRIEDLFHTAEADECLRQVIENLRNNDLGAAREYESLLFAWNRDHWAVPVLGCTINLLASDSTLNALRCLEQLRKGWNKAGDWPKLRCQMVRALSHIHLLEASTFLMDKRGDLDPDVRIEITWVVFSRQERPSDLEQRLQRLVTAPLSEWLYELGEPLEVYDPFGKPPTEEADRAVEAFIWEHPLYEQLYAPVSTVLLARAGGGKTTARLALQRRFWGTTDAFMLDYTDFHDLVARPTRITARRHVEAILHCAARAVSNLLLDDPHMLNEIEEPAARWLIYRLLMNHLSDPYLSLQLSAALPDVELPGLLSGRVPAQAMNDLVTIVQALGFEELYLLVDRLNNLPEAQDTTVAEALFRHLLNDVAFLQVPHLHVKLFLPAGWEKSIRSCGGLCSGRVHLRKLEWDEKLLKKMLADRLQVAGMESLNRLAVDDIYPRDLDAELAREAGDSPRQLVELGETLLRLRALAWEDESRDPAKARLQTEDWAAMLEYGLRRAAESEN